MRRRKANKFNMYSFRLSAMDFKALNRAAESEGKTRSVYLRDLLEPAISAFRSFDRDPNQEELFK